MMMPGEDTVLSSERYCEFSEENSSSSDWMTCCRSLSRALANESAVPTSGRLREGEADMAGAPSVAAAAAVMPLRTAAEAFVVAAALGTLGGAPLALDAALEPEEGEERAAAWELPSTSYPSQKLAAVEAAATEEVELLLLLPCLALPAAMAMPTLLPPLPETGLRLSVRAARAEADAFEPELATLEARESRLSTELARARPPLREPLPALREGEGALRGMGGGAETRADSTECVEGSDCWLLLSWPASRE